MVVMVVTVVVPLSSRCGDLGDGSGAGHLTGECGCRGSGTECREEGEGNSHGEFEKPCTVK
jgi:hypothetical protein